MAFTQALKHSGRFKGPMWNVEGAHDGEGRPAVQVCQVQGVEYHCFQSTKDPFALSAWARVKLARLNEPAHAYFWPDRPLRLYAPLEPRAMLARLLGRAAMSALELREADQFCEPVSRRVRSMLMLLVLPSHSRQRGPCCCVHGCVG